MYIENIVTIVLSTRFRWSSLHQNWAEGVFLNHYIAIISLQKLLSDERFVSVETDSDEKQLLNQMLNAVKVTPSLNEDLQVEVMKVSVSHTSVLPAEAA